jgi:pyrimidine-nucleoside phosphorylase
VIGIQTVDILQHKRDGIELSAEEIEAFIQGYTRGRIPDYQAAALAMAIVLRGMTTAETTALTTAMLRSGVTMSWPSPPGPIIDKHSTGGVGDKTSLVAAPIAAACGLFIPMIAGRGLGHTGGTLDKMGAIPGLRLRMSLDELQQTVRRAGLAIVGPTEEIAPADRRIFALRDVTATVDSVPLIAASILSKKLAEGIDGLVLDVKFGDGAFMGDLRSAHTLAQMMIAVARGLGCRAHAVLTDMSQPLGFAVGNSLEVAESIETLKGRGPRDVESLSLELAARMIWMGGVTDSLELARVRARSALMSGAALQRFQGVIEAQGGDPRVCDDLRRLPQASQQLVIPAPREGRLRSIACREIGRTAMRLGAGRRVIEDRIDPGAGVVLHKKVGDLVMEGEPLLTAYGHDEATLAASRDTLEAAVAIAREGPALQPLIRGVVGDDDGAGAAAP